MDLVLGLSLTSTTVRWVLVEGTTGEGAPVDRGSLDIQAIDAMDADLLLDVILTPDVLAEGQMFAVGITCTSEAMLAAGALLNALATRGQRNVTVVCDGDAATALAKGVADITDYDDVAVCIVEPDSALVALVAQGSVTVERIDRSPGGASAVELVRCVSAALNDRPTDAIFVVGSDDVDPIVSRLEASTDVPVFSAAEADLALARGAALAAARQVDDGRPQEWSQPGLPSRIGVLSSVLAAAVVTFVVSLSVALGLSLTTHSAVDQSANVAAVEPVPAMPSSALQPVPPPKRFTPNAVPKLARTMVVAAPPAPEPVAVPVYAPEPVYQPPAPVSAPPPVYLPPAPVYQPPAPVYVPPPPVKEPRLRDRIIERIPIINRFHEPQR